MNRRKFLKGLLAVPAVSFLGFSKMAGAKEEISVLPGAFEGFPDICTLEEMKREALSIQIYGKPGMLVDR